MKSCPHLTLERKRGNGSKMYILELPHVNTSLDGQTDGQGVSGNTTFIFFYFSFFSFSSYYFFFFFLFSFFFFFAISPFRNKLAIGDNQLGIHWYADINLCWYADTNTAGKSSFSAKYWHIGNIFYCRYRYCRYQKKKVRICQYFRY